MAFQGGRVIRGKPQPTPTASNGAEKFKEVSFVSSILKGDEITSLDNCSNDDVEKTKFIFNFEEPKLLPHKSYKVKSIERETLRDLWNFYVTIEGDLQKMTEIEQIITRHVVLENPISFATLAQESRNNENLLDHLYNGNLCLLMHKDDWHRGVIHEANEVGKSKVLFLDSGIRMKKSLENIFIAPKDLRSFPPLAYRCKLMSIPQNEKGLWDDSIYEKLLLIANKNNFNPSFNGNDEDIEKNGETKKLNVQEGNFFVNPINLLSARKSFTQIKNNEDTHSNESSIRKNNHETTDATNKNPTLILKSIKFDKIEKTNIVEFTVFSQGEKIKLSDFFDQISNHSENKSKIKEKDNGNYENGSIECEKKIKTTLDEEIMSKYTRPSILLTDALNTRFVVHHAYPCGEVYHVMEKKLHKAGLFNIVDEIVYYFKNSNPQPCDEFIVGDLILAPYFTKADKFEYFQRAVILNEFSQTCRVKFIDIGGILEIDKKRMRKVNEKMASILPCGYEVKIFGLNEALQHIYSGDLTAMSKALVHKNWKLHKIHNMDSSPPEVDFLMKFDKEEHLVSSIISRLQVWRWEKLLNAGFKTVDLIRQHSESSLVTKCSKMLSIPYNEEVEVTVVRLMEDGKSIRISNIQSPEIQRDQRILHAQLQKFGNEVSGSPFVPKIDEAVIIKLNNEWMRGVRVSTKIETINGMFETAICLLETGAILPFKHNEINYEFKDIIPDFDRIPPFVVTCQIKNFVGEYDLGPEKLKVVNNFFKEGRKIKVIFSKDDHSFKKQYEGPIYFQCQFLTQRLSIMKKQHGA